MLKSGPSASPPASDSPCGHCPGALGLSEPLFLGFRNEGRVLTLTPPPPPLHAFWPQDMCVCSTAKTTGHSPQALSSGPGPHPEAPIQAALSVCWWCWGRGGRVSTSGYWEGSLWTVGGPPPPPGLTRQGWGQGAGAVPAVGQRTGWGGRTGSAGTFLGPGLTLEVLRREQSARAKGMGVT